MRIITILLFFVYMYGLGFSLTFFLKNSSNSFERYLMRIAIGIGIFTILSTFFALLKIPLNWWLFLLLSLITLLIYFLRQGKKHFSIPKLTFKKSTIYFLIVFVLFIFTLSMYTKGAFVYDYYEDGDPWRHAGAAKYIALEKTALEPIGGEELFQYIDPYPPAYDILIAMLYQTSGDIIWTTKFFNALIISLGIIFFYIFAKTLMNDRKKALFSTFVLAMIPCYMSHFIWAHTLVIVLIFPLFYSAEMVKTDKRWWIITSIVFAAVWLAQPTQAIKITILFVIYFIFKLIFDKQFIKEYIFAGISAAILSIVVWWGPTMLKYRSLSAAFGTSSGTLSGQRSFLKFVGTADRVYNFNDFFIAKSQNMINNPIGVGVFLMLLLFITIIFLIIKNKSLLKEENKWQILVLVWLIFTLIGIHGHRLPVQLWAFRFWMLFAIFFSLFVSIGMFDMLRICKKYGIPSLLIIVIVLGGIWFTSGKQKYAVNTAIWGPSGEFVQYGQFEAWEFIRELPKDTKIFYPCLKNKIGDQSLLAYDMYTCIWCEDELIFKSNFLSYNITQINSFLKNKRYQYLFIDGHCTKDGENETNKKISEISNSGLFSISHQTQGSLIWKII
jgi:hypothetical protein